MAQLYRKASLDKLSSPDQLDKAITIISPAFWLAAIGGAVIIAAVLIWSIVGRLPVNVNVTGMYMGSMGVGSVAAEAGGIVDEVYVQNGDFVEEGQALIHLDAENTEEELKDLQERRAAVEAVTFASDNDVPTADNKSLLDLKAQRILTGNNLQADQIALADKQKELEEQTAKTEDARNRYEAARSSYLSSMGMPNTSGAQMDLQDATSQLSEAKQELAGAESALNQAQNTISTLSAQKTQLEASVTAASLEYDNAQAAMQQADAEMTAALEEQRQAEAAGDETAAKAAEAKYQAALLNYDAASNAANTADTARNQYLSQLNSVTSQLQQAQDAAREAADSVSDKTADVNSAQYSYDTAENNYISAVGSSNAAQASSSQAGTIYSAATQDYNTELSVQRNLEQTVSQLETQVKADEEALEKQNESLKLQFDSARAGILDQLDQQIKEKEKLAETNTVTANRDGYVAGVNVAEGNVIQPGTAVCRISTEKDTDDTIICYVPVSEGRKLSSGMKAVIYLSTVNRQEYGHIEGSVTEVSDYVVSSEEMVNQLGDVSLAQAFQQSGPVVQVICSMERDESTASGYKWSSKKGADVVITEGTMITADVIVEEKAPITMVLPILKEKFTIHRDTAAQGQG